MTIRLGTVYKFSGVSLVEENRLPQFKRTKPWICGFFPTSFTSPKTPIFRAQKIPCEDDLEAPPTNPLSGPGDIEALPFRSIISDEFQHDTPGCRKAFAGKVWHGTGHSNYGCLAEVWEHCLGWVKILWEVSWFSLMCEGNGTGKANGTK